MFMWPQDVAIETRRVSIFVMVPLSFLAVSRLSALTSVALTAMRQVAAKQDCMADVLKNVFIAPSFGYD
jgi:hypothetical protein